MFQAKLKCFYRNFSLSCIIPFRPYVRTNDLLNYFQCSIEHQILDRILRQSSKEFSNFRNKSIRKTRIEIFEEKMAKESNALECMGDDFILKALTTEPQKIK